MLFLELVYVNQEKNAFMLQVVIPKSDRLNPHVGDTCDKSFLLHRLNVVLLLSESRAIINYLDLILHGFMLPMINITVFQVKQSHASHSII
jgi:hypothetical protein